MLLCKSLNIIIQINLSTLILYVVGQILINVLILRLDQNFFKPVSVVLFTELLGFTLLNPPCLTIHYG